MPPDNDPAVQTFDVAVRGNYSAHPSLRHEASGRWDSCPAYPARRADPRRSLWFETGSMPSHEVETARRKHMRPSCNTAFPFEGSAQGESRKTGQKWDFLTGTTQQMAME